MTSERPLNRKLRAFSHKINFNFHVFIRPIQTVLCRPTRCVGLHCITLYVLHMALAIPILDCFVDMLQCKVVMQVHKDDEVAMSTGGEVGVKVELVVILHTCFAGRGKSSSVSSSSHSTSDPHTHCPSTDLYTPNYTQQPHDGIHSSPLM